MYISCMSNDYNVESNWENAGEEFSTFLCVCTCVLLFLINFVQTLWKPTDNE